MLDLAIVFLVYGGLRAYEKYRSNTQEKVSENVLMPTLTNEEARRRDLHYMKVSGVAVGLGLARAYYAPVAVLSVGVFTYAAIPYLRQIETSLLKDKKVDGHVLYGIADFMTLGLNRYATAAFCLGLVHTARFIISNAQKKKKKMLINVFARQPHEVYLLKEGVEICVPLESVQENDIIVVTTGQVIPTDGTIVRGIAAIDQRALTGESQPAEKEVGSLVFASTILITGHIHIKVSKSGQDTTIAKIGQILNDSVNFQTSQQLRGQQWADSWNLPILALAFASWPMMGAVSVVSILNGHIAQTIRVTAPLSTLNHLNIASHKGILVKNGRALEKLSQIDTIIFDKTGTLTSDRPKVGRIILTPNTTYTENQILAWAAAAERKLAHPIAYAIIESAERRNLLLPEIADSEFHIGYGITVNINGQIVRVGSQRFMELEQIAIPASLQTVLAESHNDGHSMIMISIDEQVQGALEMHATVRPEVKKMIRQLRQRGIQHLAIVSGDHQNPTRKLAEELGMDSYFYDILPEDKAKIVAELKYQNRSVCFIGDGVNDAIAMKTADISISLSGATSIATDVAQIVFMDGSLKHLVDLFEISDSLEKNLQNSLLINVVPGAITIASTYLFHIDILVAVLISQSGLLIGVGNAMLPLRQFKLKERNELLIDRKQQFEQLHHEQQLLTT